mgnify:CR=1 FL=1
MARPTVGIEGLDALDARLASALTSAAYEAGMQKACRIVETAAKKKAPRDTGALKASITHETTIEGKQIVGYVGTPIEYAPYQEYGAGRKTPWAYTDERTGETIWTAGNKPHPFLRPALNENQKRVQEILHDAVRKGMGL